MTLRDLAERSTPLPLRDLGTDRALTLEVQTRLADLGLLDPPADGFFGPVSIWALQTFQHLTGEEPDDFLAPRTAHTLLTERADTLLPLDLGPHGLGGDLAARLVRALYRRGHWVARAPGTVNIVYVEGMDARGRFHDDAPNHFNDCRILLSATGRPRIEGLWEATTEPGHHYTFNPMNPRGAARIAFGQYKAWTVGFHRGEHEALCQNGNVRVHRDLNRDFERDGDAEEVGGGFGLNQHWGYDRPVNDIGRASAGCLVGRTRDGHRAFMARVKDDARYRTSRAYRFMTTVLKGSALDVEFAEDDARREALDRRTNRLDPIPLRPPVPLPGGAPRLTDLDIDLR